jgi:putative hydrolase of the HAD superfamily
MKNFEKIKNIIFDLGGVLFCLDGEETLKAFENHGIKNIREKFSEVILSDWFRDFEIGNISPEEFLKELNTLCGSNLSMKDFVFCWNAMLTGYPEENRAFLENISKKYNLYVLSNTNITHVEFFEPVAAWRDGLFKKRYYSNDIHLRKPDKECFEFVLSDAGIEPHETLFIDDRADNIAAAKSLGINTIHLTQQSSLFGFFK